MASPPPGSPAPVPPPDGTPAPTAISWDPHGWTVVEPSGAPGVASRAASGVAQSQRGSQSATGAPGALDHAVGHRLGPYDILDVIARGGQGVVYKARHRELGTLVALKILLQHKAARAVQLFRQEAQVLARLRHPNLIVVTDLGEMMGVPFLAMDYVRGADLKSIVDQRGPLGFEEARAVVEPIARTLQFCHDRGLVHRDVKPQNILMEERTARPILIDFGLLKRAEQFEKEYGAIAPAAQPQSEAGGTPSFMAPEQTGATGFGAVGPRSDVYGLGSTLYYLLTGKFPLRGPTMLTTLKMVVAEVPVDPRVHRPDVPAVLAELCLKAMAKRQEDRPVSAEAFADVLRPRPPPEGDAEFYRQRGCARRDAGDLTGALSDFARAAEMLAPGDPLEQKLDEERRSVEAQLARRGETRPVVKLAAALAFILLAGVSAFAFLRGPPGIDWSDKTPPELTLAPPPEWDGGPLAVSCTVRDAQPKGVRWQLVIDGRPAGAPFEAAVGPTGRVDARLELASVTSGTIGSLRVTAVAEDRAGNTSRAEVEVPIRRQPPRIAIESPRDRLVTNARTVAVRAVVGSGRLRGGEVVLRAGDEERARLPLRVTAGNVVFLEALPLPGEDVDCVVEVRSTDLVGNTGRAAAALRVDRTPPELVVVAPAGEPVVREEEVRVQGRVRDASAVTVLLDGRALPVEGEGAFAGPFRLAREGRNEGRVVARDEAGNEAEVAVAAVRDRTPPRLLAVRRIPPEPEVTAERLSVVLVTDEACTATVAGSPARRDPDGRTHSLDVTLPLGKTSLGVVLTDSLGNTVRLEPPQLVVERVLPAVLRPAWWPLAPAQSEYAVEQQLVVAFENGLGMRFALIPPGTFRMGSPESEPGRETDEFAHEVALTRAFYAGANEVTNAQFRRFRPAHDSGEFRGKDLRGDEHPVVNVTLAEAREFCRWLDAQAGVEGVHRLPTEAEWERAYRAETDGPYFWGTAPGDGKAHANGAGLEAALYAGLEERDVFPFRDEWLATAPVGRLKPNAFGLCDMAGNAAEWVSDRFGSYPTELARDPVGPASGKHAVARGGSFAEGPFRCRAAFRQALADGRYPTIGFRVVANRAVLRR